MLISVLVPVLGRPQNAAPVLESLRRSTRGRPQIELIFLCSRNDLEQMDACRIAVALDRERGGESRVAVAERLPTEGHDYPRKMNHGARIALGQWLLLGSDDITFEPGWEVEMLRVAEATGKRVIGSNDMANRIVMQKHLFSTHTLVARSYFEDPGASLDGPRTIASEAYDHNFCDRELAGLAMQRDEWAFAPLAIIRHHHPAFGGAKPDATYEKGHATFLADQEVFWERAERWGRHGLLPQELSIIKRSAARRARLAGRDATARARRARS